MKTIISTGQGRLHLIESAKAIKKAGIEIKIVTGWVPPSFLSDRFLNVLGSFLGRSNLAYGLRKRTPKELLRKEILANSFSEFYIQFLFLLSNRNIIRRNTAAVAGWRLFGKMTKRHIKNANIFHVRSGAGYIAIDKARKQGMIIVVDHSIAHPLEIQKQLSKIYKPKEIPVDPNSGLWKMVLDDCSKADIVLVNSSYVKKTFVENGYNPDQLKVIQLGIREDFFSLKNNYEISQKLKIIYTGSVIKRKGAHLIIEAAKELLTKNIPFEIHLIGSVSHEIEIPKYLVKDEILFFHGHLSQDELKFHLMNADIYVFPSYCEGSAQALKEAMAIGLPVIATEQSGGPIKHGFNGLIIKDDSSIAITNSIIELSKDKILRQELGVNAAKTISNDHTWEKYGNNVAKLYQKLLQK